MVRDRHVLYSLTCKCASRSSGVNPKVFGDRQFFNILTCKNPLATAACNSFHILISKSVPRPSVFNFLPCRSAAACHFSTSQLQKSGPNMVCFVHFDFEMCFVLPLFCLTTNALSTRVFAIAFWHVMHWLFNQLTNLFGGLNWPQVYLWYTSLFVLVILARLHLSTPPRNSFASYGLWPFTKQEFRNC